MKRPELTHTFLTPILELGAVGGAYMIAYYLRGITDGIPFVQLRIPYISYEQFVPFILSGVTIWLFVFATKGLYGLRDDTPLIEEIRLVLTYSFFWVIFYMSFVYLSTGFLFKKEIPRLIIFYVYILSTIFSILIRVFRHFLYAHLYKKGYIEKRIIYVLHDNHETAQLPENPSTKYVYIGLKHIDIISRSIRKREIDTIISLSSEQASPQIREIIELARVYGVSFVYPKLLPGIQRFTRKERLIGDMPVVEVTAISISAWERIIKRTIDIIFSFLGIILLSPIMLIVAIGVKLSDPAGPTIFRNQRIGKDGEKFFLYKFRYMYWKYCIKDAYGVSPKDDDALQFEEELKKKNDTRNGPLYKIKNDPRKMKFGSFIERLSLDELPQLWNVLIGDMSLIGPRPHQPREVEQYREADHQVLTVKPGITGMAQVYGRDQNSWEEEVIRDRYYIEHYSLTLDIAILLRTVFVVMGRVIKK